MDIGQTGPAQYLDMHEDIFFAAEGVGKSKPFAFVEPLDSGRLQRRTADHLRVDLVQIGQPRMLYVIGRIDRVNGHGLPATLRLLNIQLHSGPVRNGTLTEVAKHIGVQQYIRTAFISDNKTEPFNRVEPFNAPFYSANLIVFCRHFFLPNSLHPQDCLYTCFISLPACKLKITINFNVLHFT